MTIHLCIVSLQTFEETNNTFSSIISDVHGGPSNSLLSTGLVSLWNDLQAEIPSACDTSPSMDPLEDTVAGVSSCYPLVDDNEEPGLFSSTDSLNLARFLEELSIVETHQDMSASGMFNASIIGADKSVTAEQDPNNVAFMEPTHDSEGIASSLWRLLVVLILWVCS